MSMPPAPGDLTDAASEAWRAVQRINGAWVHNRTDDLLELLHEAMVIVPPGGGEPVRGRAACIDSYRDFTVQARVLRFEELSPSIDVFEHTAVVAYDFAITYEIGGTWTTERGRDVLVLTRQGDSWRAVWRTQLPSDGAASS